MTLDQLMTGLASVRKVYGGKVEVVVLDKNGFYNGQIQLIFEHQYKYLFLEADQTLSDGAKSLQV